MPNRCPNCSSAIEAESTPGKDHVCPACGSSIPRDPQATSIWLPAHAPRRIGKFELLEEIGVGTFGTVYKARDTELDRLVAIKVPRGGGLPSPAEIERFLREARSAAALRHPGIVALHDAGQIENVCFLVHEYIQGATLAERRSSGGRFSFRKTAELVAQAADALQYAHAQGVVHRDIKTSNIMIDLEGRPHIMDFGLAKRVTEETTMTLEGQVLGTPAYMAPEQARGEVSKIDARSDIYSLGVILYELLTGELPFRGQTRMLLVQVMQDEPRPPRKLNDRIPKDLETICLKAMAKEPRLRYASAGELADDLRRYLRGEPIRARPIGRVRRLWRWCRSNPAVATASLAAVGALAAAALLSFWFGLYQRETAATLRAETVKTEQALAQARQAEHEARRQTGIQMLERGQALCAQQQAPEGLLWLVQGLKEMPEDETALRRVLRANLGQWLTQVNALRAFLVHQEAIAAVAFSPDSKTVLTGSADGTARFWDTATGRPVGTPLVHRGPVYAVAFSPDGLSVLTGGEDQVAHRWDVATCRSLASFSHRASVRAVAFSPDGKTVLTGSSDHSARLWEATTSNPIGAPLQHDGGVVVVAFSPDGKLALTAGKDKFVRLWDAATGRSVGKPWPHQGDVRSAAFSPDGNTVLTGSADRCARLWEIATGRLLFPPLQHPGGVTVVAYSPDGKTLLTGCEDQAARLWDAATCRSVGAPLQHRGRVSAVAFSPDGKTVLTGADDQTARLWEAATGQPLGSPLHHEHWVQAVAFSPDGKTAITGSVDHAARLWEVATEQSLGTFRHQATVNSVAFSPNGQVLLTGCEDRTARQWEVASGQPIGPPMQHTSGVNTVDFNPDGKTLLTAAGNAVQLWETATGRPLGFPLMHPGTVMSAAFSPDGKTILTGCADGKGRLWETATGRLVYPPLPHRDRVTSAAFSPDGKRIVTGCYDRTAQVWDAATGRPIGKPLEHQAAVWAAAFSPDGKTIATGCWDNTVRLWEAESGTPLGAPIRLLRPIWSLTYGHDSKTVLTGTMDFMARQWDTATGRPIGPIWEHQEGVFGLAARSDGALVASGSGDRTTRLWVVRPPLEDTPDQLNLALSVLTGLELDASGAVRLLDAREWEERRRQLAGHADAPWQRERLLPAATAWHTAQEAEAEHENKPFAAIWHLNRLINLEPNAWFWYARRTRLHLQTGDLTQARADDARAQACVSGPDLVNWYRHQLADCRFGEHWTEALWYVERLLAARPRDGDLYATRAEIHRHLDKPEEAAADLARAIEQGAAPALTAISHHSLPMP